MLLYEEKRRLLNFQKDTSYSYSINNRRREVEHRERPLPPKLK